MSGIELENVSKRFSTDVLAVDDISMVIAPGEFVVLVGPSGCGKSTLLRLIAGLEHVTRGCIRIGGRDVTDLEPRHRDIAMVFQNYALYPHMNVEQNLRFSLAVRKTAKKEIAPRVERVASVLGLTALRDRKPAALSGGQRQRVAIGRAMVREPVAFLMDEPLSNLDAKLRVQMRTELARLHDRLRTTTIYVTHDQIEAMTLGSRVAVLRDGVLQQFSTPEELFENPANLFVAAFIGSPSMNVIQATIDGDRVRLGATSLSVPAHFLKAAVSREVILGLRPHAFEASDLSDPSLPRMSVVPEVVENLGSEIHIAFFMDATPVNVEGAYGEGAGEKDEAQLIFDDADRALFVARVSPGVHVRRGEPLSLAIRHSDMYLFDRQSGTAIGRRNVPGTDTGARIGGSLAAMRRSDRTGDVRAG